MGSLFVAAVINYALSVIPANYMSPDIFAQYSLVLSLFFLMTVWSGVLQMIVLQYVLSSQQYSLDVIWDMIWVVVCISLFVGWWLWIIMTFMFGISVVYILLIMMMIVPTMIVVSMRSHMQWVWYLGQCSIIIFVETIFKAIGIIILISFDIVTIEWLLLVMLIAVLLALLIGWILWWVVISRFRLWIRSVALLFQQYMAVICMIITMTWFIHGDMILFYLLYPDSSVEYIVTSRIWQILYMCSSIITSVTIPMVVQYRSQYILWWWLLLILIWSAIYAMIFWIRPVELISLLFGSNLNLNSSLLWWWLYTGIVRSVVWYILYMTVLLRLPWVVTVMLWSLCLYVCAHLWWWLMSWDRWYHIYMLMCVWILMIIRLLYLIIVHYISTKSN